MPEADAFALLGLPRAFDLDQRALQAAYLKRAAALHPDRFSDPLQREDAQGVAAALNDARAVLADDEQRANLLLSLLGGPAKEQDKSLPDGFLIDMLEIRQEMEAALAAGGAGAGTAGGADESERARLESWARQRRQQHIDAVRHRFASLEAAAPPSVNAPALGDIRRELNAWRYIERMLEQLRDAPE